MRKKTPFPAGKSRKPSPIAAKKRAVRTRKPTVVPPPAPAVLMNQKITQVNTDILFPCPLNRPYRTGMTPESIRELANSILAAGRIIEPLVVRARAQGGHEIVCGERRWRAAQLIPLPSVPCIISDLSDSDAAKLQLIENLDREGIHPIEEAEGYQRLMDTETSAAAVGKPATVESIAAMVKKSPSHIYGRLKLLSLPPLAKQACLQGKLSDSVALFIARIPDEAKRQSATLEILDPEGHASDFPADRERHALDPSIAPMTYRQAKDHVMSKYVVRLRGAPFDINEEGLGGGLPCTKCIWYSTNARAKYPDMAPDMCLEPACYAEKKKTTLKRDAAKAKAEGHTLLSGREAKRVLQSDTVQAGYVDLGAPFPGTKKTWGDTLATKVPDHIVQAHDDSRQTHYLVSVADAIEAAKAANLQLPKPWLESAQVADATEDRAETGKQDAAAHDQKLKRMDAAIAATLAQLEAKVRAGEPTVDWYRWLVKAALFSTADAEAERFGCSSGKALMARIEKDAQPTLRWMLVSLLALGNLRTWDGELDPAFLSACSFYGINFKQVLDNTPTP